MFHYNYMLLRLSLPRNWSSHGEMYLQKCRELEIDPDERALPKPETEKPAGLSKQASLDSFVEAPPNVKWSRQGLLEHIMDFVISDDQVNTFYFVIAVSKEFFSLSGLLT
jgi:hypothetical protein